jgi:hypothetical protein
LQLSSHEQPGDAQYCWVHVSHGSDGSERLHQLPEQQKVPDGPALHVAPG